MKYVAVIKDEHVVTVVVADDNDSLDVIATVNGGDRAVDVTGEQTLPGPGWTVSGNELRPPSPFPSWHWEDGNWEPPVPFPDTDGQWEWDENSKNWVRVSPA